MHLIRRSLLLVAALAAAAACAPAPGQSHSVAPAVSQQGGDAPAPRSPEPGAAEEMDDPTSNPDLIDDDVATTSPTSAPPSSVPPEAIPSTTVPPTVSPEPAVVPDPAPSADPVAPLAPAPTPTVERAPEPASAPSIPGGELSAEAVGGGDVAAAQLTVLERGHVDLIEVTRDGNALRVQVKDDTGPSVAFRSPEQVQIRVGDRARTEVPDGPFGFLGAPGSPIHLLPQVQDPELIWPGWSTERLTAGQVVGDAVQVRLVDVDGPGELSLFTTDQFGSPTVLFDSDGAADRVSVPIRTHAHANWAFSEPGVHRVTFEVAADVPGAGPTSTRVTYVFLVGDAAAPVDPGTVASPTVVDPGDEVQGGPGAQGSDTAAPSSGASGTAGTGGASTGSAASGSSGSGSLARTGGSADTMVLMGLGLLASGLVVSAMAAAGVRRRRPRTARG